MFFRLGSGGGSNEKRKEKTDQFHSRLNELEQNGQFISALQARFPETAQINILSIGCGDEPYELEALRPFFNERQLAFNYVGIDVNEDDIKVCQGNYQNNNNVKFQVIDGMNYPEIAKLFQGDIHIILMRHPMLFSQNPPTAHISKFFERMFTTTIPYLLAEGGNLIVSLYHPEEKSSFLELTKLITDAQPIALSESTKVFYQTEYVVTPLGDMPRELYSDRYFFTVPNFQPNLVMRAEKENGVFETEHDYLAPVIQKLASIHEELYPLKNKDYMIAARLDHVIKEAIKWKKHHPEETSFSKLAEVITQHLGDDIPPAKIETLNHISFDLLKRPLNEVHAPMNRKKYISVANAIMQTIMKDGNLNDCYKALAVVAARPIILPQAPEQKKESAPYMPGLGF
jgi:hypothetical protein